jgi:Rrf2 family protein
MKNLLNISEAANLGLHTMVFLARNPGRKVLAREIAETHHASEAHLAKVLQRLRRAGLVRSTRGPGGGFVLAREPKQTRLLDVYEAMEGPMVLRDCLFDEKVCRGSGCVMGGTLQQVNRAFRNYFRKTTLAALAKKSRNGK